MRIMHLLKHAVRGNGHVHVAVDLACAQADAGHDVVFASARGSFDDVLRAHGVDVVDVPEAVSRRQAAISALALLRLVRRAQPDVMHAHMMSSAVIGFVVAKATGSTLVTTVHNSFEPHAHLMRLGKLVVAVSDAERQKLIGQGFRSRKVVTVLNGALDSPRHDVPTDDIGHLARPCVVTLSGLHRRKAVDDVVRAFSQVAVDFPAWHLDIVGSGPDRGALEVLVRELHLEASVRLLGDTWTPQYLLEEADVFAMASLADPCPLVVTEARGAGCAVVATDVDGVPELLGHGRAGQLVPVRDPAAMAAAFRTLMGDPEALATWRARSARGAEHFTVRRVAADYEQVYRMALGRENGAGRQAPVLT